MTMILFLTTALFSREGRLCFMLNQIKRCCQKTLARGISLQIFCKQKIISTRQITDMDSRILKKKELIVFFKIILLYFERRQV